MHPKKVHHFEAQKWAAKSEPVKQQKLSYQAVSELQVDNNSWLSESAQVKTREPS